MPQIGPAEILVVVLVALLVFGPHRLPEVGRQVGKGLRELRKLQETVRGEFDSVLHGTEEPEPPAAAAADVEPAAGEPVVAELAAAEPVTAGPVPEATPRTTPTPTPTRPAPRAPSRFRPPAPGPTV